MKDVKEIIRERLIAEYGADIENLVVTSYTDIDDNVYYCFAQVEFVSCGAACYQTALISNEGNAYLSEFGTQIATEADVRKALEAGTIW